MPEIIDISIGLTAQIPVWLGSPGFQLERILKLEDDEPANTCWIEMDVHAGTHVDAPWHFIPDGATAETLDLNVLIGPVRVAHLPVADSIRSGDLKTLDLPKGTERLLLRTRNSHLWEAGESQFQKNFVALTVDAANWLVDQGIRLIGVDYLSVQRFGDPPDTHEVLLTAGVIILECLDLSRVTAGCYDLYCLPLKLVGAEGAPKRAVLVSRDRVPSP